MPTNRELELDRMKKLDVMMEKLDRILTLLENKISEPRKKVARKISKSN